MDLDLEFETRTKKHIALVNKYAAKLDKEFPDHDKDKLHKYYTAYLLLYESKYRELSKAEQALVDTGTNLHIVTNTHHPEYWEKDKTILDKFTRNNPICNLDVSTMPKYAIDEMCCDWCAMSEEFNNTPFEWFEKVNGSRWIFNKQQEEYILEVLDKLWRKENEKSN